MRYGKKMTALLLAGLVGTATLVPAGTAWAAGWQQEGSQWKYIDTVSYTHLDVYKRQMFYRCN